MNALLRYVLNDRTDRQYQDFGYKVFRGVLPKDRVDALAEIVRNVVVPHQGALLRQDGRMAPHDFFPGTTLIRNPLANAHLPISQAMEPLEAALTAVVTASQVAEALRKLDGADQYSIHQTLLFFAAQTTGLHIDSWGVDTAPHGFAHTLWIPLQDMTPESGLPSVIPWPRGKVLSEADLGLPSSGSNADRYDRYHRALSGRLMAGSPEVATAVVRRGDMIVWTSLTPHFTLPARNFPSERLSLQVLLRPTHTRWGNFIVQPSDHPTNRHIRKTERFSYFVYDAISRDFGIAGSLPTPAAL
ncbi:Phytanoyl-CoA dioxygenase (PhyH) [Rhodospirillales bacterium URHD0017]|nr:Phytanoyl-CoA dioxygenase (PhyH) [Rhodospirillales bacterium URHD0017]